MSSTARESGRVEVRLSQVPLELRRRVADLIVEKSGMTGIDALELQLRAMVPRQDPVLLVSADKARMVIERGRLPTGSMPKVWEW